MKIALRILGAFLILFLILALFTPKHHDVERSALIMSPSEIVFDQINDLNKWAAWSPWDKMDPEMKKTFGTSTIGPLYRYAPKKTQECLESFLVTPIESKWNLLYEEIIRWNRLLGKQHDLIQNKSNPSTIRSVIKI